MHQQHDIVARQARATIDRLRLIDSVAVARRLKLDETSRSWPPAAFTRFAPADRAGLQRLLQMDAGRPHHPLNWHRAALARACAQPRAHRIYLAIRRALWEFEEFSSLQIYARRTLETVIELAFREAFPWYLSVAAEQVTALARLGKRTYRDRVRELECFAITRPARRIHLFGNGTGENDGFHLKTDSRNESGSKSHPGAADLRAADSRRSDGFHLKTDVQVTSGCHRGRDSHDTSGCHPGTDSHDTSGCHPGTDSHDTSGCHRGSDSHDTSGGHPGTDAPDRSGEPRAGELRQYDGFHLKAIHSAPGSRAAALPQWPCAANGFGVDTGSGATGDAGGPPLEDIPQWLIRYRRGRPGNKRRAAWWINYDLLCGTGRVLPCFVFSTETLAKLYRDRNRRFGRAFPGLKDADESFAALERAWAQSGPLPPAGLRAALWEGMEFNEGA